MNNLLYYQNDTYKITLSPLGASMIRLETKDKFGRFNNIVFTYQDYAQYTNNKKFAGVTVGPYTGRIYPPTITQNNQTYTLGEKAPHLHGGKDSFALKQFHVKSLKNQIIFTLKPHYIHYPAPNQIEVIYHFHKNHFTITYQTTTDHDTYVNLTNHSYFNLSGFYQDSIKAHHLKLPATKVSKLSNKTLPLGYDDVEDTMFDFNTEKPLKKTLELLSTTAQKGLDHCYLLKPHEPIVLKHPMSKRILKITTDYPAVQVYSNNYPSKHTNDYGVQDQQHHYICFEAQHPANDIHTFKKPSSFQAANTTKAYHITYHFKEV